MSPGDTSVRFTLEYWAFCVASALFRALPITMASAISGALWRWCAPLSRRHRRAMGHLAQAMPEFDAPRREAIVRAMWEQLGRTFAEAFHLPEMRDGRVTVIDTDLVRAIAQSGKGVVFCAPHLGNWEIAVVGLQGTGLAAHSIYQRVKNPLVDEAIHAMRRVLYGGGLVPKAPQVPRQFMRLAREGNAIALLADLRDYTGVAVPFFGRPAPSTTFPAVLARYAAIPLVAVQVIRDPGVRFRIHIETVDVPHTDDAKADVTQATAALQAVFERFVRERPEQWMWAHRRWG